MLNAYRQKRKTCWFRDLFVGLPMGPPLLDKELHSNEYCIYNRYIYYDGQSLYVNVMRILRDFNMKHSNFLAWHYSYAYCHTSILINNDYDVETRTLFQMTRIIPINHFMEKIYLWALGIKLRDKRELSSPIFNVHMHSQFMCHITHILTYYLMWNII